jgi:hypothetical protein
MGLSEHRVPSKLMLYHHFPYEMAIFIGIPIFRHTKILEYTPLYKSY